MFRTQSKVEKGRVAAHEGAETGVEKIHTLIDKVAEHAESGSEKASVAGAAAAAKGQELKAQAADARKQAAKDAKKRSKGLRKDARKRGKKVSADAHDLKDTFVDDILPKVVETAAGLAAAGTVASKNFADEAGKRAPEAFAALKDDHDAQAAMDALKGQRRKKKKGWKLFLLALVAGGAAAYVAKKQQAPKKDPWAVPAGDPYKAPESGRDSSLGAAAPAVSAPLAADALATDEAIDATDGGLDGGNVTAVDASTPDDGLDAAAAGETRPLTSDEIDDLASDDPAEAGTGGGDGSDAWSSASDWADESSVPSVADDSKQADVHTEHLGNDDNR